MQLLQHGQHSSRPGDDAWSPCPSTFSGKKEAPNELPGLSEVTGGNGDHGDQPFAHTAPIPSFGSTTSHVCGPCAFAKIIGFVYGHSFIGFENKQWFEMGFRHKFAPQKIADVSTQVLLVKSYRLLCFNLNVSTSPYLELYSYSVVFLS